MSESQKLKKRQARERELQARQRGQRQHKTHSHRVRGNLPAVVHSTGQLTNTQQPEQGNPVVEDQDHDPANPLEDIQDGAEAVDAPMANAHPAGGGQPQAGAPQADVAVAPGAPIPDPSETVPDGAAAHEAAGPNPTQPTAVATEELLRTLLGRMQAVMTPATPAGGIQTSQQRATEDANAELRVIRSLKLDEYNGREEKGKLQTWKFRLTRTFEHYRVKAEWQLGIAADLLKGVAEQWYMRLVEDGTAPTTITQLYEMLQQRFVPQAAEDEARGKLHALHCQSESQISDYIQRFEALTAAIPTSDLADRKWRFRWGLRKFPDLFVTLNKSPDIGAAIQAARDYEQARKDSQRHGEGQSRPHPNHVTSHCEGGDQPRRFQGFKDKFKPKWQSGHGKRWQDRRQVQQERPQGMQRESNGHQFQKGRGRPQGQPHGGRRDFKPRGTSKFNRDGRRPGAPASGQSQA